MSRKVSDAARMSKTLLPPVWAARARGGGTVARPVRVSWRWRFSAVAFSRAARAAGASEATLSYIRARDTGAPVPATDPVARACPPFRFTVPGTRISRSRFPTWVSHVQPYP